MVDRTREGALKASGRGKGWTGERFVPVVAAMVVLELVAGGAVLAAAGRAGAPGRSPSVVTLAPAEQARPATQRPAAPARPVADIVVTPSVVVETATAPVSPAPAAAAQRATSAAPAPPAAAAPRPHRPAPKPDAAQPQAAQPQAQPAPPPPEPRMRTAATETESERIFREQFPAHAAARQIEGEPASLHWAVIVGVNDYAGRTDDTIGSRGDALTLREELLRRGWRDDHILLLLDRAATHDNIVRGLEWLARSTDARSVVIFSFSGHMRYQRGDPDGDGEARDSGLWPADNRFIWDSDVARMLNAIPAARMWASFQGCHSGGMNDPGMERPGRVVTYSSLERQKSYEDPEVNHSVQGWYMFAEGIRDGHGDADRDGRVSVQEAYHWNAPRAHARTSQRQNPQLADGLGRPFYLDIA